MTLKHVHRWTPWHDIYQCHCGKTQKSKPVNQRDVQERRSHAIAARKRREGDVQMTRDPRYTDRAGRRRGLLGRAAYLTQVQIGLGRTCTKEEVRLVFADRLNHVPPKDCLKKLQPTKWRCNGCERLYTKLDADRLCPRCRKMFNDMVTA